VGHRIGTTLALCLVLLVVGLAAPAAGSDAVLDAPVRVETLDGAAVPRKAPLPFSMVGLTVPAGARAEVRTSPDGRMWSEWLPVELHPDEGPDPDSPEEAAEPGATAAVDSLPLWVGEAREVQTRVAGADPDAVEVHLVDSAGLSRSVGRRVGDALRAAWRGTPQPAMAAANRPVIRSRAEWGANEEASSPAGVARRARHGFVHHTVNANGYAPADVPAILRGVQAYHINVQGWSDIGYNLLVDRFGGVWEGRAGGVENAVIGAQAGGFNTGSFGVALLGDFSAGPPPAAAVDGLAGLLAWKYDVHHVDVLGQVDVRSGGSTRFPAGQVVRLPTLAGHRDVSTTTCPAGVYGLLGGLRERIAAAQGPVLLDHAAGPEGVRIVDGETLDGPITFSTRLRPAGDWRLEVRAPDGGVVHTAGGSGDFASSTWTPSRAVRGRYTYTFSADGRRSASDVVDLTAPEVADIAVEPPRARVGEGGGLAEPVRLRARLWPDARWTVSVRAPGGTEVFSQSGTGEFADATWDGAGAEPGTYTWRIGGNDVEPATGDLLVARDALRRIGASGDAVADSLELSRAAFPEAASARHAVLARADVFADTMAGGPLAGEDGPVLLTGSAELDPRVSDELDRVLAEDGVVYLLGGVEALGSAVAEAVAGRWEQVRLGGSGRTDTAALVAERVVARSGATTALVARADGGPAPWADALAGGAYGADRGIPVLLTDTVTLSAAAGEAIEELGITETVVLGGNAAVSPQVEAALPGARRVWGSDRAGTAAAVARDLWGVTGGQDGDRLLLAGAYAEDAWSLPLAATPLAARADAPLYVTDVASLPPDTAGALRALGYSPERQASGWVLGGDARVSPAIVDEVAALLG
jgi:hypothetical protein